MNFKSAINTNHPYLVAETAFSHEGDKNYLLSNIDCLKNSGADAIKFQLLLNKDDYISKDHDLYEKTDKWMLKKEEWLNIIQKANEEELEVIATALDFDAINFINNNIDLISAIEIHPSCIIDVQLFKKACKLSSKHNKPLLLGISGFEFDEISEIVNFAKNYNANDILLIYGFQNYPTNYESLNLDRIKILKEATGCKIVFADHTKWDDYKKELIILTAYNLGSNIQEIHFVEKMGSERLDYITAVDANFFTELKNKLEVSYKALGKATFKLTDDEKKYSKTFKKTPIYKKNVNKGETLKKEDISYKRTKNKFENHKFFEIENLIGKKLKVPKNYGDEIKHDDLL